MFLGFNQKSMISVMLLSIGFSSCGMKTSNDVNTKTNTVSVSPELGVSVQAPDDILYVASAGEMSLMKSTGLLSQNSTVNLFSVTGDGGLGADLNTTDTLNPYPGIPIITNKKDMSDSDAKSISIHVTGDGDEKCKNLINYDASSSEIKFTDTSSIDQLTTCEIQISVAGSVNGKTIQDQKSIPVTLNPTLAVYAKANDPTYEFLKAKTALKDLNLIVQWIKKPEQSSNLKIDPKLVSDKIENLNALTGAKNLTNLDLSKTALKDIRAILYFPNLEKLDISDTRIDPKDLALLGQLKKLKSLAVRNLALKDLTFITNNIPNLTELDISGNTKIEDLSDVKNLKNLLVLKASNIGFTNFDQLSQITQLNTLDISQNDLSHLQKNDLQKLVNLYSLRSLNVSKTHIPDSFLNDYFGAIAIRNTLTTFIDSNFYDREVIGGCENINVIDNIPNLMNLTQLTYLDLHGNGCNDTGVTQKGLTRTAFFTTMTNLQYLDISDSVVHDLSGVTFNYLRNLKTLVLVDSDGNGISMDKEQCAYFFGGDTHGIAADCNKLDGGKIQTKTYSPGTYTWEVPTNVHSVTITGCSGANSGAQGAGGGGGATLFSGNWQHDSHGGDGGSSGNVNGQSNAVRGSNGTTGSNCVGFPCKGDHQAGNGGNGADGGVGEQTYFGEQKFSIASPFVQRDPNTACIGGSNGSAGRGGRGMNAQAGNGGAGGANTTVPWNSQIEHYTIQVEPHAVISFVIGAAGAEPNNGGQGGGGQGGEHTYGTSESGQPGSPGVKGQDGYLKIEWSQ